MALLPLAGKTENRRTLVSRRYHKSFYGQGCLLVTLEIFQSIVAIGKGWYILSFLKVIQNDKRELSNEHYQK